MKHSDLNREAVKMLADGTSQRKVAEALGLTRWAVHELAMGHGEASKPMNPQSPLVRTDIVRKLRRGWTTASTIADDIGATEQQIVDTINHLREHGYNVLWDANRVCIVQEARPRQKFVDGTPLVGSARTFGFITDTHLCSTAERLDVFEACYEDCANRGIQSIYHAGNVVDGECRFNRYELKAHGVADQAEYAIQHIPRRKGITLYYITADDHEGWWQQREGIDFGRYLQYVANERGRHDLVCMGYQEVDVELKSPGGSAIMRVVHPGGGSAYALSYSTQKIIESLQGGEKPGIMLVGHYHKSMYHVCRNVHVVQGGCAEDQTTFMRKKKIEAHVGYWIISVRQDAKGAPRQFSPTFVEFFDRGYHVAAVAK